MNVLILYEAACSCYNGKILNAKFSFFFGGCHQQTEFNPPLTVLLNY